MGLKKLSGEDDQQCENDDQIDLPGIATLLPIFQRIDWPPDGVTHQSGEMAAVPVWLHADFV